MIKAVIFQLEGVICDNKNTLVPYVIDLIQSLYDNRVKLIINSFLPEDNIIEKIEHLNIKDYFVGYLSEVQEESTKSTPDQFLCAAELIKVKPEECIVLASTTKGIHAAAAANMIGIGYISPFAKNQDLSKAALLIEGFDEVDYCFLNQIYQQISLESETILKTKRLILRELATYDIPTLYEMYQDPRLQRFQNDFMGTLENEVAKHIAYIKNIYRYYGYGLWGIHLKDNNCLIGRCGIEFIKLEDKNEFELGYMIAPDYQGLGYATEIVEAVINYAFDKLNAKRVVAIIDKLNLPSIRLAEKVGMKLCKEIMRNQRACWLYEITPRKGA